MDAVGCLRLGENDTGADINSAPNPTTHPHTANANNYKFCYDTMILLFDSSQRMSLHLVRAHHSSFYRGHLPGPERIDLGCSFRKEIHIPYGQAPY